MPLIDFILHIDHHLINIVHLFGPWTYLIIFGIIFIETGLVIFPFLPGDSLIFAAQAMAVNPQYGLNPWITWGVAFLAAVLGDTINYEIGVRAVKYGEKWAWLKKFINDEHRKAAENFFATHGSITIVVGRFIPFIRTFVPFIAGGSSMHYRTFLTYNVIGGFLWTGLFALVGHFFGNIPVVQKHFSLIVIGIILISVVPVLIVWLRKKIIENKTKKLRG